jgi:predicted nucleotidyltransferase
MVWESRQAMSNSVDIVNDLVLQSMADMIVEEVHPDEVVLFGSHARGTQRNGSDVDFLVVMPEAEKTRRGRRRITGRIYRRLASFPVPKDILVYTREEVERWRAVPGHIVSTGLSEGKRLYVRS